MMGWTIFFVLAAARAGKAGERLVSLSPVKMVVVGQVPILVTEHP